MNKLLATPQLGTKERLALYASTIAFQWLAVAVVAWRTWVHGYTASELGIAIHGKTTILTAAIVGAATIATLQWLNLRRLGKLPQKARGRFQAIAERIFPQSPVETFPYLALAITAGLCEEFLYRGFAVAAFARMGLRVGLVVLLTSVLFALAHFYQGREGIVGTLLVGSLLGIARIVYESLVPAVFWHTALDIVAGVAGPRYLLTSPMRAENRGRIVGA